MRKSGTDLQNIAKLAIRNSRHYARYTTAATFAIALGFVALTVFTCYMRDAERYMQTVMGRRFMFGDLLIERKSMNQNGGQFSTTDLLSVEEQKFIDQFAAAAEHGVDALGSFLVLPGSISIGKEASIFVGKGFDPSKGAALRGETWAFDAMAGRPLQQGDGLDDIAVGRKLATLLDCSVDPSADQLSITGYPKGERPFRCPKPSVALRATTASGVSNVLDATIIGVVNGILADVDMRQVLLPLPFMQQLFDTTGVSYYAVKLAAGRDVEGFAASLVAAAAKQGFELRAIPWANHRFGEMYLRCMEFMDVVERYITSIMLAIAGLAVFATFLRLVDERTREIGTLRALGFVDLSVASIFATEALILSALGIAVGSIMALALSAVINALAIPYQLFGLTESLPFHVSYEIDVYLRSAAFVTSVGVSGAMLATLGKLRLAVARNLADN